MVYHPTYFKRKTRFVFNKLFAFQLLLVGSWLFVIQTLYTRNLSREIGLLLLKHQNDISVDIKDGGKVVVEDVKLVHTVREPAPDNTGSEVNCTVYTERKRSTEEDHPDEGTITAYCHKIYYRIPTKSYNKTRDIIVGVLSGAGGNGPERRQSIRETWANGRDGVFFLVGGSWSEISKEYETYQDLVWIDEEEVYDGERSVLTYKTASFISIVHILSTRLNKEYGYIFKTDDDSYVNLPNLHKQIYSKTHEPYDYWGWCQRKKFKPLRGPDNKWSVSYETYPEPMYPRYCQGAGFALSRKFIECMAGEKGLFQARYMPFEDVAIGLQAERCSITPTMVEKAHFFRMYRTNTAKERDSVNFNKGSLNKKDIPTPDMFEKIVQHRIQSDHDMKEHHKAARDPNYWKNHATEAEVEYYYGKQS